MPYDTRLAERARRLLPGASETRLFGGIGLLERGHLVVGVSRDDLVVRVPLEETARWLRAPGAHPMRGGKGLQGWVKVSATALVSDAALLEWVRRAQTVVGGLPEKRPKKGPPTQRARRSR